LRFPGNVVLNDDLVQPARQGIANAEKGIALGADAAARIGEAHVAEEVHRGVIRRALVEQHFQRLLLALHVHFLRFARTQALAQEDAGAEHRKSQVGDFLTHVPPRDRGQHQPRPL
jgi:hypothetical protein